LISLLAIFSLALGCSSPALQTPATLPSATITALPAGIPETIAPTGSKAETSSLTPGPTGSVLTTPEPTPAGEATASPNPQYILSAVLDYNAHHLAVEEQIVYPNRASEPIPDLVLVVEPSRYPEVFRLNSLVWEDGTPIQDVERDIGYLRISLPQPLPPGEILRLSISYELYLPSPSASYYGRPVPFGYSPRQTNLVDWYPFLPPYRPGQGWQVNQGSYFGEHLVYEAADFQVEIRLEEGGRDLLVAASAPAEQDGAWRRYQLDSARNFVWSVSDQYQLSTRDAGSVTVLGYAFPEHPEAGEAALQATVEALAVFADLFGPYPQSTLSLVEADFLDGMEYDGLYFLSKGFYNLYSGTPADYLTAIAAHETAHQWWYALVGNDQANEPWLDEALSTYSERLFYERLHPEGLDWWWTYRIHYYDPAGPVDGSVYNPQGFRPYRDAIYLNGALFLEDLRALTGDQAFFAFLKDYANTYAHRIATAADFFAVLEKHSQADLSPLFQKYFTSIPNPQ
jgi:hypothetical protein